MHKLWRHVWPFALWTQTKVRILFDLQHLLLVGQKALLNLSYFVHLIKASVEPYLAWCFFLVILFEIDVIRFPPATLVWVIKFISHSCFICLALPRITVLTISTFSADLAPRPGRVYRLLRIWGVSLALVEFRGGFDPVYILGLLGSQGCYITCVTFRMSSGTTKTGRTRGMVMLGFNWFLNSSTFLSCNFDAFWSYDWLLITFVAQATGIGI